MNLYSYEFQYRILWMFLFADGSQNRISSLNFSDHCRFRKIYVNAVQVSEILEITFFLKRHTLL